MLSDIKIGIKIIAGFIILIFAGSFIGITGMVYIKKIEKSDTYLHKNITLSLENVMVIATSFHRIRVNMRDMIRNNDLEEINKNKDRIKELSEIMNKHIDNMEEKHLSDNLTDELKILKSSIKNYNNHLDEIISLAKTNKDEEAIAILDGKGEVSVNEVRDCLDRMMAVITEDAKNTSENNRESANNATMVMIIAIIAGLFIAVCFSIYLYRNIEKITNILTEETNCLIDAALAGKLDIRGNPQKVNFEFRPIIEGINNILDAVIGPLNVASEYIERISKGELPPKITDKYNGDFNEIKNNLNICIEAINAMIKDTDTLVKAAIAGRLDTRAASEKHGGDFKKIIDDITEVRVNNTYKLP